MMNQRELFTTVWQGWVTCSGLEEAALDRDVEEGFGSSWMQLSLYRCNKIDERVW